MSYLKKLFIGNYLLCLHYIETLKKLYFFMPEIKQISYQSKEKENYEIKFDKEKINNINSDFKEINKKILDIEKDVMDPFGYKVKMVIFFIIRLIMIYNVYYKQYNILILLSLTQFILLPYSFFTSFSMVLDFVIARNLGSYISSLVLNNLVDLICPTWMNFKYEIDNSFVFGIIFIDQLICFIFLFVTPQGKTALFSFNRIMQSIIFGFLNTKTYMVILLLLVRGYNFPITTFVIDLLIGLSTKIFNWSILYRPLFVYIQHRSAHIAVVYGEAHKYHHYLNDTTAFDNHYMGIGAPEEYFMFLLEILPVFLFNGMLPSLSPPLIWQNWDSKKAHVRKEGDFNGIGNFHANHHFYHTKNYSTYSCPLDVLFNTSLNMEFHHFINGFKIKREENEKQVVLKFIK